MSTDTGLTDLERCGANALKLVVGLILFPLLPVAVAFNLAGMADRLSGLPGIEKEGGIVSGLAALAMIGLVLGILIGGASAVLGVNIPVISDDGEPPVTHTPAATPEPTPAQNSTPTEIPTTTSAPTPQMSDREAFMADYRTRLAQTMEDDTLTGVPVLAMDYQGYDNGTDELWVIYWECDGLEYAKQQRVTLATDFANTVGNFDGDKPARLRTYAVLNLESHNDSTTSILTSSAERFYNMTMESSTYHKNWADRLRKPKETETNIAFEMVVNESGRSTAEEAFNEKYPISESEMECVGGAEPGDDETETTTSVPP